MQTVASPKLQVPDLDAASPKSFAYPFLIHTCSELFRDTGGTQVVQQGLGRQQEQGRMDLGRWLQEQQDARQGSQG